MVIRTIVLTVLSVFMSIFAVHAEMLDQTQEAGLTITVESPARGDIRLLIQGIRKADSSPEILTLENPSRIVLDIPNNRRAGDVKREMPDGFLLSRVRIGGHTGKTRIVLDLREEAIPSHTMSNQISLDGSFSLLLHKQAPRIPVRVTPKVDLEQKRIDVAAAELALPRVEKKAPEIVAPLVVKPETIQPRQKEITKVSPPSPPPPLPKKKAIQTAKKRVALRKKHPKKQAYTINGDTISVVPVGDKKAFSKTPVNPAAEYPETQKQNTLPSVLGELPQKAYLDLDEPQENTDDRNNTSANVPAQEEVTTQAAEEEQPKDDLSDQMVIPITPTNQLEISDIPPIEQFHQQSGLYELIVSLLLITLLVIFLLRREEIVTLLLHRKHHIESPRETEIIERDGHLPYVILGCKETDTDEEIKARYRHLVKVFHGDSLQAQALPKEVLELTDEQFRRVQQAYEHVRDIRGF